MCSFCLPLGSVFTQPSSVLSPPFFPALWSHLSLILSRGPQGGAKSVLCVPSTRQPRISPSLRVPWHRGESRDGKVTEMKEGNAVGDLAQVLPM